MDVFDKRNEQKRETDKSETKVYFKERDIFFIKM